MNKLSYEDPNRPKILALDVDGTALKYDGDHTGFGKALRGMSEELHRLKDDGWMIVIWTCRKDTPELRAHLKNEEIPFDHVNDHPYNGPDDPRKIHADVYADDKAFSHNGVVSGFAEKVKRFKPWWQGAEWL